MNNEILNELRTIDEQIDELTTRVIELENEINNGVTITSDNDVLLDKLSIVYNFYKSRYIEIIEKTKATLILENSWCEAVERGISNNAMAVMPTISVDVNSIGSIELALEQAENVIIAPDGSINFSNISRDFIEFYRNLIVQKHEYTQRYYDDKLKEISKAYSKGVIQKINEYKVDGEEFKYNIGGAIFELNSKDDIMSLYDAINDYEISREFEQEVTPTIEEVKPIPLSQVSPEVKARFGLIENEKIEAKKEKYVELKSGAIAKIKEFKAKADKTIRLIGGKLVATKNNLVENLKSYYSHVNIANVDNIETDFSEPKALPAGEEVYVQPEEVAEDSKTTFSENTVEMPNVIESTINGEPVTINGIPEVIKVAPIAEPVVNENINEVSSEYVEDKANSSMSGKEALLSKYSDLIRERVLGKHAGEVENLHKEQIDFEIDNYLDNLIKVGEEKYGNNFVEDIINEPTAEPIKWLMDEVSQGENLKEISEDTINKVVAQIDNMDEYEFEDYLKVTLGKDDLGEFNKLVNDYMEKYPNSNEFTASKEVLKVMVNKIQLAKPSSVIGTQYIQVPNEQTNILEPIVIETQAINAMGDTKPLKPVYEENFTVTIDKMNEIQFAEYINALNLSMEELNQFNSLVRKYKEDYPGVTKTFAEKACIKTILDQRKLEQSRMAKSSTI